MWPDHICGGSWQLGAVLQGHNLLPAYVQTPTDRDVNDSGLQQLSSLDKDIKPHLSWLILLMKHYLDINILPTECFWCSI